MRVWERTYVGRDEVERAAELPLGAVGRACALLVFWSLLGDGLRVL